jgi:hypothetical protein
MRSRLGIFLLTAAIGMSPAGAGAQDWKKHSYAKDGFEVDFSGPVKVFPIELDEKTRAIVVRSTNYMQELGDEAYIVGVMLYRESKVPFERVVKASFASFNCKDVSVNRPLESASGPAREMGATGCHDGTLSAQVRYYLVGDRFYQVIAVYKTQGDGAARASHFLRSFALTGN